MATTNVTLFGMSMTDAIFLLIVSIIMVNVLYFGSRGISDITSNEYLIVLFYILVFGIYFIIMSIYFLGFTLQSILIYFLMFFAFAGLLAYFAIYFGSKMCKEIDHIAEAQLYSYIVIILQFMILMLGLFDRNNYYSWNGWDTVRFLIMLILIRLNYWIFSKYEMPYLKTSNDIISLLAIFFGGKRIYTLLLQQKEFPYHKKTQIP